VTYIFDNEPEIIRAACEVAWLETLHEGLRNGTTSWHTWNDQLVGQDRTGTAIDESRRALVLAIAAMEQLIRQRAMSRKDRPEQSADADGDTGTAVAADENALPERAGWAFCARGSVRVCGRRGTRRAAGCWRRGRGPYCTAAVAGRAASGSGNACGRRPRGTWRRR
jgi:hypothetical protein